MLLVRWLLEQTRLALEVKKPGRFVLSMAAVERTLKLFVGLRIACETLGRGERLLGVAALV